MPDYETPSQSYETPAPDTELEQDVVNESATQDIVGNAALNSEMPSMPAGVDTPLLDSIPATTTGLQTALTSPAGQDLDPVAVSQAITDLYSMAPEDRARFATELPAMFDAMSPEQRAMVGSIMMMQGNAFQEGFEGGDITADPTFQAMADIQRAWGEYTAFQGYDPLGRQIDVSVSTTSEDYGVYRDDIAAFRDQEAANGRNVWSDMFMPYTMWTRAGNIARYAETANVTWVGADGLRTGAWSNNAYAGNNVTFDEREAAGSIEQRGDGVITLPDGTTLVQTHMGLNKAVEESEFNRPTGFTNGRGEWVELPSEPAPQTTTPAEDLPVQQPLFDLEPYEVGALEDESPVPGHMPVPDTEADATDPANQPYLELAFRRVGFDEQLHFDASSQTIRIGADQISVTDFQTIAGLDGIDIAGAMTRITTDPEGIVAQTRLAGLNLDPSGLITGTIGTETTRDGTTSGVNAEVELDLANGSGTGSLNYTRGNGSAGVNATVQFDENGNLVGYGGGFQGSYQFNDLMIGGGIAVLDTQQQEILDAETATGADAAVVANLGGGPVLMVGEEHHLQIDVNGGVQSGAFGANVGVGSDSGTAVHFYQSMDPSQLPSDPAALQALADQVGWPNLEQVYGVGDIDMLAMQPGQAYRFDDFSAAHANAGVSVYGVGVSLGIEGQEYESVMVSRTDDETVRISVMATDAEGWNAGLDFQGVGLAGTDNSSGHTTLVELDVDVTTEEGRDALEVFRTTGALPGSYDQAFVAQALQLSAMEAELATLDPMSDRAVELRDAYGTLSTDLHAQATASNSAFVGDPELMTQPDIAPGVTYGHRNDTDFQSHRNNLLGFLQWGSSETLGQDRIFQDGQLDVTMTMNRTETGFWEWLMHGEHGVEQGGSVVNPHHDLFSFGVFANKTMNDEDRALLATLPQSEDPMTQAWIDGDIDMDAVGQVGVFLTDDHIERMQDGFQAMRDAGLDPTAATALAMQTQGGSAMTALLVMRQDGLIDQATLDALGEEGVDVNALAVAPPSEFATMSPAAQEAYLGYYLRAAESTGANPWTAMDMISQLPPGPERDEMMNTLAIQIERKDGDHATGAFDMIRMINDMGQVDPSVQADLQTAVVVSITDRDVAEGLAATSEQRQQAYLQGRGGANDPNGVWRYLTGDVQQYMADIEANNMTADPGMIQSNVQQITSIVVMADRAGELDTYMAAMDGDVGSLLDAMGPLPGNQQLVLRSLLDSPAYGAEALAWAEANGIDTTGW
ncbi:MAG: hypothetical protein KC621_22755 [Myxococcales bacterium]|nr:hypothetical protein [Myxococcales bacterium]